MGSIIERKRADRTTGYTAQIMIKKAGKLIHSEAQTFDRRQAAAAWMEKRERVIRAQRRLDKAQRPGGTLADAIDKCVTTTLQEIGRTKAQVLNSIKEYEITRKDCEKVTGADIVAFAQELSSGRAPQTVGNYLGHLGAVFAVARPVSSRTCVILRWPCPALHQRQQCGHKRPSHNVCRMRRQPTATPPCIGTFISSRSNRSSGFAR